MWYMVSGMYVLIFRVCLPYKNGSCCQLLFTSIKEFYFFEKKIFQFYTKKIFSIYIMQ